MKLGPAPRSYILSPKLLLCLSAVLARSAFGNPSGEHTTVGTAKFDRSGNLLQVTTGQQNTIIDWQNFSIAAGEQTNFLQPGADAATLNRVNGGNPSEIFGSLESNGKILLLNPNGILVGLTGRIDTAGFIASTLNVSNSEFLAGKDLHFSGTSAAAVDNRGTIRAVGGDIYLLGDKVSNSGALIAHKGKVGLGAGSDILLKQAGNDRISVRPGLSGTVTNSGAIAAVQAELKAHSDNLYALAINNTGVIRATGAAYRDGRVLLTSDGGTVSNSGRIQARNAGGAGGKVQMHGGQVLVSGTIDVSSSVGSGATGGVVRLSGVNVGLFDAAAINASGETGGGAISIGGGLHGTDSSIQNALHTFVAQNASIRADALKAGNGGQVVVWSDNATRFFGSIDAVGAGPGGNGGVAEVSGKEYLEFKGKANLAGATGGKPGMLLMDPMDIVIQDSADADTQYLNSSNTTVAFADSPDHATFDWTPGTGSFAGIGNGTTIELQAQRNITVSGSTAFDVAASTGASNVSLTLRAGNNIDINAPVLVSGSGSLLVSANDAGNPMPGATGILSVNAGGSLSVENGSMSLSGLAVHINAGGQLYSDRGTVTVSASNIAISGTIATAIPGDVVLVSSGSITEAGVGSIQTDTLSVQSVNGMSLDGDNSINQFQAVNSGTGAIVVHNGISPFSIVGITQQTGDITIVNNGAVMTGGTIQTLGAGNISLTAIGGSLTIGDVISNGGTGSISLNTVGTGDITFNAQLWTTGTASLQSAGAISGPGGVIGSSMATLNATAVNGIVLNGYNDVGVFSGTNTGINDIVFTNASAALTLGGLANSGGNILVNTAGALLVGGPVVTSGSGSVSFTAGGTVSETVGGSISTPAFTVNSVGGVNLAGPNAVAALTGTNSGGGDFKFNGTAPVLTVQEVVQSAGGNISVVNSGALILPESLTTTGTVTVGGLTISGTTDFGSSALGISSPGSVTISTDPDAGADLTLASPLAALGNVATGGGFVLDTGGRSLTVAGTLSSRGITLSTGTGAIEVTGALQANNGPLILTSDSISLQGPVDGYGMAYFQTSTPTLNVLLGSAASNGGSVNGDYRLDDTSLSQISGNFAGVSFGGALSSQLIVVNPASGFSFTSPVILQSPFNGTVEVDGPLAATGFASVSINATTINLAATGGDAISTGRQGILLNGSVWLKNDTSISTAGGSFSNIGTLNGSSNLAINTGNGSISFWGASSNQPNGSIGGQQALASLTLTTSGTINLLPDITTTGDQIYGAVSGASVINRVGGGRSRSFNDGNITFNGPLVGIAGVTLGIATSGTTGGGTVTFNGPVTSGSAGGLNIVADQVVFGGAGSVNIQGPISLAPGTAGQALEIGGNLNGAATHYDLAAFTTSTNALTFGNSSTGPVTIFDGFSASGPLTVFSGSTVTMSGALSAPGVSLLGQLNVLGGSISSPNQPVTLKAVQLTDNLLIDTGSTNAAVKFLSSVSGLNTTDLTVSSGSGAITFSGVVGGGAFSNSIGDVDLRTSGTVAIQAGFCGTSLRAATAANALLSGSIQATQGDITIGNTTTLTGVTTLFSSGIVYLGGSVLDPAGSALTISSAGSIAQHGGWQVPGAVTLSAGSGNIVLTSSANTFGGALRLAGNNATVYANGPVNLGNCSLTGSLAVVSSGIATTVLSSSTAVVSSTTAVSGTVNSTGVVTVNTSGTVTTGSPSAITQSGFITTGGPALFQATVFSGTAAAVTTGSSFSSRTIVSSNTTTYTGTVVNSSTTTTVAPGVAGSVTLDNTHNAFSGPVTLISGSNATLFNTVSGTLVNCSVPNVLKAQSGVDISVPASNSFGSLSLVGRNATVTSGSGVALATTTLSGTLSLTAGGAITQTAPLVISGSNLSVIRSTATGGAITLNGSSNQVACPVSFSTTGSAGDVAFRNGTASVLGSGTVGGSLTVFSSSISQATGTRLAVNGTAGFTATTAIALSSTGNSINGNVALNGASVGYSGSAGGFGPIHASSLTLNAACDVTQAGAWLVTGSAAVNAAGHRVTLQDLTSSYGSLAVSASDTVLSVNGPLTLGSSVISGSLSVASNGSIVQSGSLRVSDVSAFVASGTGSNVTLDNAGDSFGNSVTLVAGNNATLVNSISGTTRLANCSVPGLLKLQTGVSGDISIPTSNSFGSLGMTGRSATVVSAAPVQLAATTLSGSLSLTSSGSISQLAPISVGAGTSAFTAGGDIVLNQSTNRFSGSLAFNTSPAGDVNFRNSMATTIGGGTVNGDFIVVSSGALTQAGQGLAITGNESLSTTSGGVSLNNAGSSVGGNLIVQSSGPISQSSSAKVTVAGNASLAALGSVSLSGSANSVGGNLTVQSSGAITQVASSQLTVGGSASITASTGIALSGSGNAIAGNLAMIGSTVVFTGSAGTFGPIQALNLTLNPTCNVIESGVWRVSGATAINAGGTGDIALNNTANTLGALHLTGRNISVWQANNASLGATSASGDLSLLSAGGNVSTAGAITVGGNLSLTSSTGLINASNAFNVAGSSAFNAATSISLSSAANTLRQAISLTVRGAGSVVLTNSANTTLAAVQSGANLTLRSAGFVQQTGPINVPGTVTLTATGGDVTLTDPRNRVGSTLAITAQNATVSTSSAVKLGAINLTSGSFGLNSAGAVTQSGAITAGSVDVTTTGSASAVALSVRNAINGPLSVSTAPSVNASVTNGKPIALVSSSIGGILSLSTPGAVTVDTSNTVARYGVVSAPSVTISSTAGDIVQTAPWKVSGSVVLNAGSNSISLGAANTLGPIQVSGSNVTVRAVGSITQCGPIVATGSSNFTSGGAILLSGTPISLTGPVSLNTPSYAVLTNPVATLLGSGSVGGTLTINSTGDISQLPDTALITPGTLTLITPGSILLGNSGNQFKTLGRITASGLGSIVINSSGAGLTVSQGVAAENVTIQTIGTLTLGAQAVLTGHEVWVAAVGGSFINNATSTGISINPSIGDIFQVYSTSRAIKKGLISGLGTDVVGAQPVPALGVFLRSNTSTFVYGTP